MELFDKLAPYAIDILGYVGMAIVILSWFFKDIKTVRLINVAGAALCMTYGFISQTYPTAFLNLILMLLNSAMLVGNRIKRKMGKEKENKQC